MESASNKFSLPSVGTDIETIARFEAYDTRERAEATRLFTPAELDYCYSRVKPAQHLAVRFCAKEALFKALCARGYTDVRLRDLEILRDPAGQGLPTVRFHDERLLHWHAEISLSHCADKALAVALVFPPADVPPSDTLPN